MTTNKEIIVLGDVEMGGGTLTDDFISDKALSNLILELGQRKHPVDLVFNGDTFDFLKCPLVIKNKNIFPRHITEDISLTKLRLIYHAHREVFLALKKFVNKTDKHIYFVVGNHDHDLFFKKIQYEIRGLLKKPLQVHFPGLKYKYLSVYVEHGHQYDFLNKINPRHLFLNYKGKKILNIPWVSFSLISKSMETKEKHPFMERIFPRQEVFANHQNLFKEITHKTLIYLAKSFLYYPLRYRYDPTYIYPKELLRELYRRYKNVHWDVDKIIDIFKKKKRRSWDLHKIHVLGHVHEKYVEDRDGKIIIHPGSWRDEYDLNVGKLVPREKRYVKIMVTEEDINYELVSLHIERTTLNFDTVRMDEYSHIVFAAGEEGFHSLLHCN